MTVKSDLIDLSQYTWERTRNGLADLGDEEYLWEPAPGCWTVRDDGRGGAIVDRTLTAPSPSPFTTLAWRIAHLIDVYGSERNQSWLDVQPPVDAVNQLAEPGWRTSMSASVALELLDAGAAYWHAALDETTDESLALTIGPRGGPYAESSRAAFVLHQVDEAIHHGAEASMMRDLYALLGPHASPRVEPEFATLAEEPDGVARAADLGRWDLVRQLVEVGAPVTSLGRGALHHAASLGDLDMVRLLVEKGAPLDALDPEWNATPTGWAEAFGRHHVVDYLRGLGD